MSSVIKSERDDVHFEHRLLKLHIKKDLVLNGFFIGGRGRSKKIATGDCKSLKQWDKSVFCKVEPVFFVLN